MAIQHVAQVPYRRVQGISDLASRQVERNFATVTEQLVPTGTVVMWAGQDGLDIPQGWVFCLGQELNRAAFSSLFKVIGTTFGVGDGSTTFNVPNMADRFPRGANNGAEVGDVGGSASASMPSHSHGGATLADGAFNVSHNIHGNNFNTSSTEPPNHTHIFGTGTVSADHGHTVNSVVFMNCNAVHGHQGGCGQLAESPSGGGCTGFGCGGSTGGINTNHTHGGTTAGVGSGIAHVHNANHGHGADNHSVGTHTHLINAEGSGDNNPPFMDFRFIIKT